jgi:hypothetical protein
VRGLRQRVRQDLRGGYARGDSHTFDCFECATHALAPICDNCGVRISGHGVEAGSMIYCCSHCARQAGHGQLRDRL